MKNALHGFMKSICGLSLATIVCSVGCRGQNPPPHGSVDQLVEQAKREGRSTVSVPDPGIVPAEVRSVDDLLLVGPVVVVAHPVAFVVSVNQRRDDLISWYKFQIDRDLSKRPISTIPANPAPGIWIPAALLPISQDEVVVGERGGTLKVGEVTVRSGSDPGQFFRTGQRYVLFLAGFESGDRAAYLALGRASIFVVASDGEHLRPLYKRDGDPVQRDVGDKFHGAVSEMARHIQERP